MTDSAKIERLKATAARHYCEFHLIGGGGGREALGNDLLKYVSLSAKMHADKFNEAMAELKKLDPNCPEYISL